MTIEPAPTVFVVDDDPEVRESLRRLVASVGLAIESYSTAQDFLDDLDAARSGCVIADIRMPGLSGLDLQEKLAERNSLLPVIILTGYAEVPTAVRAMKQGAFDFIEKPYSSQRVLDAVRQALESNRQAVEGHEERARTARLLATLTPREREVMNLVVAGKPNRVIAAHLGLQQKTVEFHRASVMKKMGADSVADLIRLALRLEPSPRNSR